MIKLTRLSDQKEFVIDGDSSEWKATKIEGIDALTLNVYTETPAIGTGEIVTGKHTGRRDISVTAHRSSHKNISTARNTIMDFFNPDDTYTMEIQYNGKDLFIDCELLAYKLPTENIHRPLDLTFTMLCPDPYFTNNNEISTSVGNFLIGGNLTIIPKISITLISETEIKIYVDNDAKPIHIVLPDDILPPPISSTRPQPYSIELDCLYGTLTNSSSEDLTSCIKSGNPMIRFKPGNHYVNFQSNARPLVSGSAVITSMHTAIVTTSSKIREVQITWPDGITKTYEYSSEKYHYSNNRDTYTLTFTNNGFIIGGTYVDDTVKYTALLEAISSNRSFATIQYKELYRGF